METLEFNVDASANNIRIDRYLADQCPEHSRSYIQKLLKEEQVRVNGHVIKANYKTQSGDYIEFHIPDPEVLDILPENIPLDILYEDDYVLVVNKPKDMVVHPSAGHTSGTLVNAVMAHCGEHLSGINGVLRPGIVHRIDKDTTGALLILSLIHISFPYICVFFLNYFSFFLSDTPQNVTILVLSFYMIFNEN